MLLFDGAKTRLAVGALSSCCERQLKTEVDWSQRLPHSAKVSPLGPEPALYLQHITLNSEL
jgi:hypothetical protein